MKINKLFAIFAGLSLLFSACTKEQGDTTPSMTLDPTSLTFVKTASTQTVKLTCNKDWKVSSTLPEWITLSQMEGTGSSNAVEIKVNVTENAGVLRTAEIVFNGGTQAKKTLQVYQAPGTEPTSIKDVKAMMTVSEGTTLPENTIIAGTIVSNKDFSNFTSNKIAYIQDEEAGVQLFFAANHSFSFGDVVSVDVSGLIIKKYAEQYEIDAIPLDKASKITTTTVEPKEVEVADFLANKYEGMYISIKQPCQVTDGDLSKTWVVSSKATSINILAQTGETFVVRSGQYSSFGTSTVPQGSGKIAGISTIYNDGMQLVFAQASDYAGLTGERFTVETPEITSSKISVILQASEGAKVTIQNATVVATAITMPDKDPQNTFLVTDADKQDFILIYHASIPGIKVGDNVTVAGTMSAYSAGTGNTKQVTGATVTINSSSTYTQPEPTDITSTFDSFSATQKNVYVSFKGTYTKSGSYYNINVSGATTNIGSILTPDGVDLTGLENVPNVTFTGYYLYKTGGKYLYFILTKAEKGTDPYLEISPASASVEANVTSAKFNISSNVDWTCTSQTEGFSVNTASGNGDAEITVNFSENTSTSDNRVATIKVNSTAGEKTYTLTQKAAATAGTIELTFPDDNSAKNKISGYDKTWTAMKGSNSITIVGFNNNSWNNNWTYIKCGRKNYASTATITTDAALGFEVSKVIVTVSALADASKVNSTKLEVASDSGFTKDLQTVNVTLSATGDIEYVVPTPAENRYYRLTFDCASHTANGIITVSKVTYKAK